MGCHLKGGDCGDCITSGRPLTWHRQVIVETPHGTTRLQKADTDIHRMSLCHAVPIGRLIANDSRVNHREASRVRLHIVYRILVAEEDIRTEEGD